VCLSSDSHQLLFAAPKILNTVIDVLEQFCFFFLINLGAQFLIPVQRHLGSDTIGSPMRSVFMFSQRASNVDRKLSRLAFATPPKRAQKPSPRYLPYPCRWLCHCRSYSSSIAQPHAISPRSTFLRQSRHGAGVVIGSRATRTFIPCARRTKWRGRGPIGGSDKCGAVALAGGSGRPSIIPHPSLPPFPSLAFRFYSWD
jgi:hypothetical protein